MKKFTNILRSGIFALLVCVASIAHSNTTEFTSAVMQAGEPAIVQGALELAYQRDGNLVVYKNIVNQPKQVVWDARTNNTACITQGSCQMQFARGVGIVLYANGNEYWRTNIRNYNEAHKLVLSEVAPHMSIRSDNDYTIWTGMSRLNWFNAMDNIRLDTNNPKSGFYGENRPGVTDFDRLFTDIGYWQRTFNNTHVFKFYTQPWARYHRLPQSEKNRLITAVTFLKQNKIAIALEFPAIERTESELNVCGRGVEGTTGVGTAQAVINNMKAAGGSIDFIAMDEPFYYSRYLASTGYFHPTNKPCLYSNDQLAAAIANTVRIVRSEFPSVVVGDIEPLYLLKGPAIQDYISFVDKLEVQMGSQLGFIHDDVSLIDEEWKKVVHPLWLKSKERNIPYGMIWNSNINDVELIPQIKAHMPDTRWVAVAIGRIKTYRSIGAIEGIHNVFQSWETYPFTAGPETSQNSLSFVSNYFYSSQNKLVESQYSTVATNRFYSDTYLHSYAVSNYFNEGYRLEGRAFNIAPQGVNNSLALNLCKVVSTGRHFTVSGTNGCNIQGVVQVTVLGSVAYTFSRNSSEALYRCRHLTTGSYLATINPHECHLARDWLIEGVMGFVN